MEPLIEELSDTNAGVRGAAAWALGSIGDKRAVNPLIGMLSDSSTFVRKNAIYSLRIIGDERAAAHIIAAFADTKGNVREGASMSMSAFLLRDFDSCNNIDFTVRPELSAVMMQFKNTQCVDILVNAMNDEREWVRQSAALGLGEIRDTSAIHCLFSHLADSNENVRLHCAIALAKMGDERVADTLVHMIYGVFPVLSVFPATGLTYFGKQGYNRLFDELEADTFFTLSQRHGIYLALKAMPDPCSFLPMLEELERLNRILKKYEGLGDYDSISSRDETKRAMDIPISILVKITGQDFGTDVEAWRRWWRKNKKNYLRK
ncbi:HEAT repeat domain-containing protein [candidate division WOR-3 bacterium]|nr:HEAT repeat domain-containing protein [candidate division WOR-3 bacterium]